MRRFVNGSAAAIFGVFCSLGCDPGANGAAADENAPAGAGTGGTAIGGSAGGGASSVIPSISLGGTSSSKMAVLFDGRVQRAERAAPISGGTLEVARDGASAVAADADRDRLFVVDLVRRSVREVATQPGDEPGRIAEGPAGTWFSVLRRGGALLVIDAASASVRARVPLCAAPRGVAFDAKANAVHVTCRQGRLITLDATTLELRRSLTLDADLRDVLVQGSELVVTRFLSAELLVLDAEGNVVRRAAPDFNPDCPVTPTAAYRAIVGPEGKVVLAHQVSSDDIVGIASGSYGFSCSGSLVTAMLTFAAPDAAAVVPTNESGLLLDPIDAPARPLDTRSFELSAASGPFDVAATPLQNRVALLATGNSWTRAAELFLGTPKFDQPPLPVTFGDAGLTAVRVEGEPVAVAFDGQGKWVLQSREPAALLFEDGTRLELSASSVADTGLAMFHVTSGVGISCASCHPEGDEDGHTWHFSFGLRRTQPLAGGVLSRAPFHWNGELATMADLVSEVMLKRMDIAGAVSEAQVTRLAEWLDAIPAPKQDIADAAATTRGEALFRSSEVGCASCHSGPQFSDNAVHDVGTGGPFQTPTLLGVGLRSALLHDGCAATLEARFGLCGGGDRHGVTSRLSEPEQADLIAYLRSL
jgi:mono/diheme cytochrome c family protein